MTVQAPRPTTTPCIEAASRDRHYPRVRVNGVLRYRHRLAYEAAYGPIPSGYVVGFLCLNKRCLNPEHMEAVTQAENVRRGWRDNRSAHVAAVQPGVSPCLYGHEPNWRRQGRGWQCRTCHRDKMRALRTRLAALLAQPHGRLAAG